MGGNHSLVDLFAGCGGLGLGFHDAGFETILANELHPDPAKTYSENLLPQNPEVMKVGSISQALSNSQLDELEIKDTEISCLAGGPPCQGFSMAGSGIANDPRNKLYREYLRVVRKLNPKTILFENVPGFANRYGLGLQKHLENSLRRSGYSIVSGVLSAKDFGVPQLRKRFICLGIKRELLSDIEFTMPDATWELSRISRELTASNVIGDLDVYNKRGGYGTGENFGPERYLSPAKSKFQKEMREISGTTTKGQTWNTLIPKHTERVIERMRRFQLGESRKDLIGTKLSTNKLSQRVLRKDSVPNITVVSLPDDYIHYNQSMPRTLSVRECARLQTFPDHFKFYGKRTTGGLRRRIDVPQYTQVGNAIPPRLGHAIAEHLKKYL